MKIDAHLDVDVVAVEQDDQLTVMLELVAPPEPPRDTPRPPATVQVVLDRSGSMAGERLDAARGALVQLAERLAPDDCFGLVAFDNDVTVVVPAGPVADKAAVRRAIEAVGPGGSTNLSAGLLRGMQEARRVAGRGGATLLLLSDGIANQGETDPARLAAVAAGARDADITTTTVGIGTGYDETLLAELARGGSGNHVFAEHADEAASAVAGEVEGLLSRTVQAASLVVRPQAPVETVTLWNDLPSVSVEGGVMIELGDLWAGEQRRIVLTLGVPAMPALGLAQVAELELRSVTLPAFAEQTVTLPVHVNVVPGDQAAGRIPDPEVRTELLFQQAQEAKRRAADALRDGDVQGARNLYAAALDHFGLAAGPAPAPEMAEELRILRDLEARTASGDAWRAAKRARMDHARKSRKRGRG